ncbi:site-specific integrase [Clostridium tyrobutyricum]|uniref:site-specific integrase n=1 Tax=Clostridium tyrobutyricum TaxID=1519 RepID=UPI00057E077C|nr:site-specific integrase [Clostridium tyrobutyricum]MBV4427168.1 site-specific integrase [Clostridium tyrobutyricum]MBV4442497.1 site-specific integrase [Clostridium tyrobutyricum]
MNIVEPIRDINLVYDIADYLKIRSERNYLLFEFGVSTAIRISDILNLRVRDVRNRNGRIKEYISIKEEKTDKINKMKVPDDLKFLIKEYVSDKKDYEFLFKSRNGCNRHITRQQAYRILSSAAKVFGINHIGCHTLRKTFGYHLYKKTKDAAAIMSLLNHSSISETLRYIGINQDRKDDIMQSVSFIRKS